MEKETGKTKSESKHKNDMNMQDPAKVEKQLRSKYGGKEIMLVARDRLIWSTDMGGEIFLTHMPEKGKPKNRVKVPKDTSFWALRKIDSAISKGILSLVDSVGTRQKNQLDNVKVEDINEESTVEEMSTIDELLFMSADNMSKELENLQKEKKPGPSFYEKLLAEEENGRKRKSHIDIIKKYL